MGIEIHCDHCGKLIRAPEGAGGKRGKCPYCEQSVYIPTPPSDTEEIPLAPLDDEAERRAEALRDESIAYAASLEKAKGPSYDVGEAKAPKRGDEGGGRSGGGGDIDVAAEVKRFVLAMSESKLDETEAILGRLKKAKVRANDYVQGLLLDQMPPKIGTVPPPLAKGFLKTLGDRLSE